MVEKVLSITPLSRSLRFRPPFERIGKETLVEWCAESISADKVPGRLYTLCYTDSDRQQAVRLLAGKDGITILKPSWPTLLRGLIEVAGLTNSRQMALIPLGYVLAPRDLLAKMLEHHQARKNSFTVEQSLPAGVSPIIFDTDLMLALEEFQIPGLPPDPVMLLMKLKSFAETSHDSPPVPIACDPYDSSTEYQLDLGKVPQRVSLELPGDIEIVRRVRLELESQRGQRRDFLALEVWLEEVTRSERDKHQQQLGPTTLLADRIKDSTEAERVLYVSTPAAFSGGEASLCQTVRYIDPRRFEKTALVSLEGVFADGLRKAGAAVICTGVDVGSPTVDNVLQGLLLLRTYDPSVVHLNTFYDFSILCAASILRIPTVLHVHMLPLEDQSDYLRSVNAIIAVSEFVRRRLLRFGVPKNRIHVIHNRVDTTYFHRSLFDKFEIRSQLGIPAHAKVALMIGRFAPQKRHDLLLRASTRVKSSTPSFYLVLAGEAFGHAGLEHFAYVQQEAERLELCDCIKWLDFVPDIRTVLAASDILVLPSDNEALPQCVVESMAMELPVVVSDSGGTQEIVKHRQSGLVFKSGDVPSLASTMTQLLGDEELCDKLARAARRYAEANLEAVTSGEQVMQVYENLIASNVKTAKA